MKMTFRWYGENDPVTLENISQIPKMTGVVSAVYDVPVGGVWSNESINRIKDLAAQHGLEFEVVESVPVHEDIKLGAPTRDEYIENYCENIRRLGAAGVKCVCYNFMPVFDWLRSDLSNPSTDGSNSLSFDNETVLSLDPVKSELSLPGWDESYTKDGLRELMAKYDGIDDEKLFENLIYFLKKVIPVCEECGVNIAIHPDDPPWGIFGLPRIIKNADNLRRMLKEVDSKNNGLTFCTGSLGADPNNNLAEMVAEFADRIHFFHARNVKITGERCFKETAHPTGCGSFDMRAILKALKDNGFDGYIRPDHGRMIWGEKGRAGYGLFDRALGATYLLGLREGLE